MPPDSPKNKSEKKSPSPARSPARSPSTAREKLKPPAREFKDPRKTEQAKQSELLDKGPNIDSEKLTAGRKAIDWALKEMQTQAYKDLFANLGITLKSVDFYLALAFKESGLNQQAVSKSNAKGLFQIKIKTNENQEESSQVVEEVNKFFNLKAIPGNIYYDNEGNDEDDDGEYRKITSQNNALIGILYWHICRDHYGNKIKSDLSSDDKDKLGNMIYKMGPTAVRKLWNAIGTPKDFNEFATTIAQKAQEAYPDDLTIPDGKVQLTTDPTYNTSYKIYLKQGESFTGQDLTIGTQTFNLPNLLQTLRYAELIPSIAKKIEAKINAPRDHYVVGENGKWLWGIAKQIYDTRMIDHVIPHFAWRGKPMKEKLTTFMEIILRYNKEILKNEDLKNVGPTDFENVKKGTKIYIPTAEFIFDFIRKLYEKKEVEKKSEPQTVDEKGEKYEKLGPSHRLKGLTVTVDLAKPKNFTIDSSAVKAKIELSAETKRGAHVKTGKKIERDQIRVKVGNLVGYFCLEGEKAISYGPIVKDGIWDSYKVSLDPDKSIVIITPKKPEIIAPPQPEPKTGPKPPPKPEPKPEPKPGPKPPEKPNPKPGLNPDQPLDLTWPEGEKKRIPEVGEAIYIGKDGKKLAIEAAKLHQEEKFPEPEYGTPEWLDPNKGSSKGEKKWQKMDQIHGIVLHATEGTIGQHAPLMKKQNTHFLLKRNGEIWQVRDPQYKTNHTGYFDASYGAIWDGNEYPYNDKIGIEVETYAYEEMINKGLVSFPVRADKDGKLNVDSAKDKNGNTFYYTTNAPSQEDTDKAWVEIGKQRSYNDAQYTQLNSLLKSLAYQHKIKKQDIITHSQLGSGIYGRGRKTDPCNLNFARLDLPDNYRRIDPDVARGTLPSQVARIEGERKGTYLDRTKVKGKLVYKLVKKGDEYHYIPSSGFGGQSFMNSGLKGAQQLCEDFGGCGPSK